MAAGGVLGVGVLPVLAHGLDDITSVGSGMLPPLPRLLLVEATALVMLGMAALVTRRARGGRTPTLQVGGTRPGSSSPADLPSVRAVLRVTVLAGIAVFGWSAVFGVSFAAGNPAPRLFFVLFWAGLGVASFALGNVWRAASPLRACSVWLDRTAGGRGSGRARLPDGWVACPPRRSSRW
ncbi:MAG: hypothetical protein ACRDZO_17945 [Egibacteraceae bacterium]